MSSQKGNVTRSRAQKHQNNTAFRNNKYGATAQVKIANAKIHDGLCKHCKGVLEWKVKYNKYKSLTQPKKCIKCSQRTVKDAYHILCKPCSLELDICCKCGKKEQIVIPINKNDGEEEEEKEEEDDKKVVEGRKKGRGRGKKDLDDLDSDDDDLSDFGDDDEEGEDLDSGSESKKTQNKSDALPDVSRVRFND